jgi:CheY-like chemotaxis protein
MSEATVLIVEDVRDNRDLVRRLLEHQGLQVLEAEDGQQALTLIRQQRPDLILLDLTLPVLDGWKVAQIVKADPELQTIPIIAVTAHAMVGDDLKALAVGCDDYVSKPFDTAALVELVLKRLQSNSA